ncbi:TonB family protein [Sphingomonas prati]|uniref:TonB family protein n=1 Tax=Sphingomonas prati TaxID=1843237 RepID=A0A7W9BPF7_9SPHN|nr:TonB family protein [Sphingomonas prati]MBB5727554.1 TonB family protein [Sphingomonas prati]GGE78844.1 hypothetical protein GCM10011404_09460 [Sphingomonas prati]
MFNFDRSDAQRIAVSAAGAILFSGLCISGAIAPAQASAAPATTLAAWQADAAQRLDAAMVKVPDNARRFARNDAVVSATVGPDGTLSDTHIVQSSGSRTADVALLSRAAQLRLAPMPADAATRTVVLKVALIDGDAPRPLRQPRATVRYAAR